MGLLGSGWLNHRQLGERCRLQDLGCMGCGYKCREEVFGVVHRVWVYCLGFRV